MGIHLEFLTFFYFIEKLFFCDDTENGSIIKKYTIYWKKLLTFEVSHDVWKVN